MRQYLFYLRLKICSYRRLFNAFPIVVKALFTLTAILIGYSFIKIELVPDTVYLTWTTLVFIFLGTAVCTIKRTEGILLKSLHIPFSFIFAVRCIFLSAPFLLLNPFGGFLSVTAGTPIVVFLSLYRNRLTGGQLSILHRIRFATPFAGAYQWVSGYRTDILWVVIAGSLLFFTALVKKNADMALAMMGIIIFAPCFSAYYKRLDSAAFIRIYKSAAYLMKKKAAETFLFSIMPPIMCLPLFCIVFPEKILLFAGVSAALLYANMALMYSSYLFYPHMIISFVFSVVLSLMPVVLCSVISFVFAAVFSATMLVLIHFLAVRNIHSFRYDI